MRSRPKLKYIAGLTLAFALATAWTADGLPTTSWRELAVPNLPAAHVLPPLDTFPVQLVLDDGVAEGGFGVGGAAARQFLWFQQFPPSPSDFALREIWVLFPSDPEISPGAAVQLVVYQDDDSDPTNGADLVYTSTEIVQFADNATFSVYSLAVPVLIQEGGDVLIGVVNRFIVSGVTPLNQPAAQDTSADQGRSWVATWAGDPPDPPLLPPDQSVFVIDAIAPGNWMVRGFGTGGPPVAIPALGGRGFAVLVLLLIAFGWTLVGRR